MECHRRSLYYFSFIHHSNLHDWWTNQNDWFMATITLGYCFNIGWFNVFTYNDGGLAFYTCLDSYLKTLKFL